MVYVYTLQSLKENKILYIGMTSDLRQRMKASKAFMDAQDAKEREQLLRRSRLGVLTSGGAG